MDAFAQIAEILDNAVEAWATRTGRNPNLARHDLEFGWQSREQLLSSVAFGLPLISEEHIANKTGDQSNLVVALQSGVAPYPRMPIQGPFVSADDISRIVAWINSGAPV